MDDHHDVRLGLFRYMEEEMADAVGAEVEVDDCHKNYDCTDRVAVSLQVHYYDHYVPVVDAVHREDADHHDDDPNEDDGYDDRKYHHSIRDDHDDDVDDGGHSTFLHHSCPFCHLY